MTTFEKLEFLLKENPGWDILGIRYFTGPELFSDQNGQFQSDSLEKSLNLLLDGDKEEEYPKYASVEKKA